MRLVRVSNPKDWKKPLDHLLSALPQHRNGKGAWRRFPFFYTALALTELDHPKAKKEREYIRPVCEKKRARLEPKDDVSRRRIAVLDRVLELA